MSKPNEQAEFAICIAAGVEDDLERWKVYRVLPDESAAEVCCLRIVDESGEDYLYSTSRFILLDLSDEVRQRLLTAEAAN